MTDSITDDEIDFLARRAGLRLTPEQRADLRGVYAHVRAMAERVRTPRTRMAEPANVFVPGEAFGA